MGLGHPFRLHEQLRETRMSRIRLASIQDHFEIAGHIDPARNVGIIVQGQAPKLGGGVRYDRGLQDRFNAVI